MEQCFLKNKLISGLQKPNNNTQCVLKEDWDNWVGITSSTALHVII